MNRYDLIASLFASLTGLAWPAAFIAAVWLFREKLSELLPHMKFKHGDTELSFRIEKAQSEANELPAASVKNVPADEADRFVALAEMSPAAAIQQAWAEIESKLRRLAQTNLPETGRPKSNVNLVRALVSHGVIPRPLEGFLHELRVIRNDAVHATSAPTLENALAYRRMVDQALANIDLPQVVHSPDGADQDA